MRSVNALVAGEQVSPNGSVLDVVDPANAETFAKVPSLDADAVTRAVDAAAAAAPGWAATPPAARAALLARTADLLEARAEQAIDDLRREGGKPRAEAAGEWGKSVATFRYYAGLAGALDGRSFDGAAPGVTSVTRQEPIGPTVAITPWNVPAASPARKLAPALLAGNPMIVKPASATPISAWHMVDALREAGAPDGVAQTVSGSGRVVGNALALDPRIAAVSFTGSTAVGLDLKHALSKTLTRIQLELGGKNAAVVLGDADLDAAADRIVVAAYALAGQQCTATSRVIVEAGVHDALLEKLVARTEALTPGDTADATTTYGPLIDEAQLDTVDGFVQRALQAGARVVTGGKRLDLAGTWYAPTIMADVAQDSELAREEVFGPVLAVLSVADVDEAIAVLNDTPYGLSSAVHTANLHHAWKVAGASEHGVVAVNGPTAGIDLPVPFGGFAASGTDSKEHGPESLRFYTRLKSVTWGWA
jgi:aldehyde dehydrogenase (NAD+)